MKKYLHSLSFYFYLFLFVVCFFVFITENKALQNNDNFIYFNYNDKFIQNTVNSNFFGDNEYLELLHKSNKFGSIVFTKDDIIFYKEVYQWNYRFGYNFQSKTTYMHFSPTVMNGKYIKLSDYEDFNSFYLDFLNDKNFKNYGSVSGNEQFIKSIIHIDDKAYKDYSYFDDFNDYTDYFIPYSIHAPSGTNMYVHATNGSYPAFSSYIQNIPRINGVYSSIGGDTVLDTYYNLYGFDSPNDTKYTNLFSIDALINSTKWPDFSISIEFNSEVEPYLPLDAFSLYGKVIENGYYYWEDIKFDTGKNSYCTVDYLKEPVYKNGKYSVTLKFDDCVNIDRYNFIYFKTKFSNSSKAYNIKHSANYILGVYVNDLYQEGLIDELVLNNTHTNVFSTPYDEYPGYFYYQEIEDLNSGKGRWNSVAFFDNVKGTPRTDILLQGTSIRNSLNERFVRFNYGYFGQSSGHSLYSYMYNTEETYSRTIKYIYKPVSDDGLPSIYISTGKISDDRLSADVTIVDKDRNPVDTSLNIKFDDFDNDPSKLTIIINNILNFFVPTKEEFTIIIDSLNTSLEEKLGAIWQLIELPLSLFNALVSDNSSDTCLNIPKINEPFTKFELYSGGSFCFNILRDRLPMVFTISDLIISVIATVSLANAFRHKFKNILGGATNVG